MNIKKLTLKSVDYPEVLREIPSPPQQLYVAGDSLDDLLKRPRVAIVGSRKVTPYGEQVTRQLARELAEQGIVIISGLALGVDALSHQAALTVGGLVIAVLPCPLEKIVPTTNLFLADRILANGGVLVSEYGLGEFPYKQNFIARNRLMSGLADVVLITEAAEKSGSLHTANFAIKQGRDVLAVPGNIYAEGSVGTNNLIKASQAGAVTSYKDVVHALHLEDHQTPAREVRGRNAHEQTVLDLLLRGVSEGDQLLEQSGLTAPEFSQALTMLEISSKIRALGANYWAIF
jgi:DNA processing protein